MQLTGDILLDNATEKPLETATGRPRRFPRCRFLAWDLSPLLSAHVWAPRPPRVCGRVGAKDYTTEIHKYTYLGESIGNVQWKSTMISEVSISGVQSFVPSVAHRLGDACQNAGSGQGEPLV